MVDIFPVLFTVNFAGLSLWAVFQAKDRMKFPIRYASKPVLAW
jgi:hypothetical protein